MPSSREGDDWLHLFTSTIRPLYISDALDVLALPVGSHVRFRYEQKYVVSDVRAGWETSDGLIGKRVLIHFAIQHPAEYHLPSYIPIREATVVGHFVEGRNYVVNFATGPIRLIAGTGEPGVPSEDVGSCIREFSEELRERLGLGDPRSRPSATIAPSQADLLEPLPDADEQLQLAQGIDFETAVKILGQALYFSPRILYRVARIERQDSTEPERLSGGRLMLTAGKRYTISIAHYQNQPPPEGTCLLIEPSLGLTLIGGPRITLASRYDVVPVEMYAEQRDDKTEGQLSVSAVPPAVGPTVHIPFVIQPSIAASVVAPSLGVAGGVAATVASLLVNNQGMKIGLAAGGAAIVGGAVMYRRSKRLS